VKLFCVFAPSNKDKYPCSIQEDGKQSVLKTKYIVYLVKVPDVDGMIILRCIFRKWEGVVGTGWSWLRIGTGGGHL
jgi:hypothetical protein